LPTLLSGGVKFNLKLEGFPCMLNLPLGVRGAAAVGEGVTIFEGTLTLQKIEETSRSRPIRRQQLGLLGRPFQSVTGDSIAFVVAVVVG
jgi:hypothetical protein